MDVTRYDDKATMVQVIAWCRQATIHFLRQCCPRYMLPNGVTRSQCISYFKSLILLLIYTSCIIYWLVTHITEYYRNEWLDECLYSQISAYYMHVASLSLDHNSISTHQQADRLFKTSFGLTPKKIPKFASLAIYEGMYQSPVAKSQWCERRFRVVTSPCVT